MPLLQIFISLIVFLLLQSGCAYPNRNFTGVGVTGQIIDKNNRPIANKKVQITLPSSYGRDINEGIGHDNQKAILITNKDGRFLHYFEPIFYQAFYMLFPPLGTVFTEIPYPTLYVQVEGIPHQYIISFEEGKFFYRTFDPVGGKTSKKFTANKNIKAKANFASLGYKENHILEAEGWVVDFTALAPN